MMNLATASHETRSAEEYYHEAKKDQLAPLWVSFNGLVPPEPRAKTTPNVWPFGVFRLHLMEAGRLITAEDAERRVLVLENPGLPGTSQITDHRPVQENLGLWRDEKA